MKAKNSANRALKTSSNPTLIVSPKFTRLATSLQDVKQRLKAISLKNRLSDEEVGHWTGLETAEEIIAAIKM